MVDHVQIFFPHQRTVLHCAASSGSVEITQLLLEKREDINIKSNDGVYECVCITHYVLLTLN